MPHYNNKLINDYLMINNKIEKKSNVHNIEENKI